MKTKLLLVLLLCSFSSFGQVLINALPATNVPDSTWLMVVGNPSTGKVYKITIDKLKDSVFLSGGGSQTLDQVLTEGNTANLLYTDANYKLANWVVPTSTPLNSNFILNIKKITPSEYGTDTTVGLWSETISEYQSGQEGSPTARKNVVWSWGYNIDQGIANEGYMRVGMESNHRPGGGDEWFEWHAPEVMTRDGAINRWYSVTGNKASPNATHIFKGNTFSFLDITGGAQLLAVSPGAFDANVDAFTVTGRTITGNYITYDFTSPSSNLSLNSSSTNDFYINTNNELYLTSNGNMHLTPTGGKVLIANTYGTDVALGHTTIFGASNFILNFAAQSSTSGAAVIQGNGGSKTDYFDISLNMPNSSGNGASIHFDNRDGVVSPLEFSVKATGGTSEVYVANVGSNGNWHFGPTRTVSPTASAQVEIESTTKGFLPPRMTKTQRDAISSPATGLVVYQTDNTPGLRCYNGTNWMRYTETAD